MEASASQGWCELLRNGDNECPKLFYNLDAGHDGFNLSFTDLVAIWKCSMNKSQILSTAKIQHTSIDPSESNSQFQVLLQKLRQGLKSRNNNLSHDEDTKSQIIHLHTYLTLPRPLQPLKWSFKLVPQDAAELGEQLLQPSLMEAAMYKQKSKALYQIIKDKDHVISRLLERLEGPSSDLSLVFPGVKPRKGRLTAAEAEKHVPGMAAFDLPSWSSRFEETSLYNNYNSKGFDNLVVGCQKCPKHNSNQHSKWVNNLPEFGKNQAFDQESPRTTQQFKDSHSNSPVKDVDLSDDEFERQLTPPHLRKKLKRSRSISSAANSEVNDSADTKQKTPSETNALYNAKPKAVQPSSKDLKDSQRSSRTKPKPRSPEPSDSETASEDDDLDSSDRVRAEIPPTHKSTQPSQSDDATTESDASGAGNKQVSKVQTTSTRKLGGIGKRKLEQSTKDLDNEPSASIRKISPKRDHAKVDRRLSTTSSDEHSQTINEHKHPTKIQSNSSQKPRRQLGRLGKKTNTAENAFTHAITVADDNGNSSSPRRSVNRTSPAQLTHAKPRNESPPSQQSSPKPNTHKEPSSIKTEVSDVKDTKSIPDHTKYRSEDPQPKESTPLTAEEIANQRREELKRKVDTGSGVRKKRKF